MKNFKELENDIKAAYEEGVTLEQAERLATKFLCAQLEVGEALYKADLNARMRKTGLKAVKAAVYMEAATSADKKPTEAMLTAIIDTNKMVGDEQDGFDTAEVERNQLENYLHVFKEAHIFFRGVAKGRFE